MNDETEFNEASHEPETAAQAEASSHLVQKAATGALWTVLGFGGGNVLRLVSSLILTRLLVEEYFGGYQDYIKARNASAQAAKTAKKQAPQRTIKTKRFGFNENRELQTLPRKIEKLEAEQADLHQKMAGPAYYKADPANLAEDRRRAAELVEELSTSYDRWEELEALQQG